MQLAIIGAGQVGAALGKAWARGGHDIVFGVRDVDKPAVVELCNTIGAAARPSADAIDGADVVVLALPWDGAEQSVKALGDLSGRIVIDCMNPLKFEDGVLSLERGFTTSGGETVAGWIPGARIVKSMNQVAFEYMEDNSMLDGPPLMFIAGDDPESKNVVRGLIAEIGFDVMDAGPLSMSRLLEPFGMVWINQALFQGEGRDWAFGARRKKA